jgi:hypothetical protein
MWTQERPTSLPAPSGVITICSPSRPPDAGRFPAGGAVATDAIFFLRELAERPHPRSYLLSIFISLRQGQKSISRGRPRRDDACPHPLTFDQLSFLCVFPSTPSAMPHLCSGVHPHLGRRKLSKAVLQGKRGL